MLIINLIKNKKGEYQCFTRKIKEVLGHIETIYTDPKQVEDDLMCHFTNEFHKGNKVVLADYVTYMRVVLDGYATYMTDLADEHVSHTFSEDKIKLVFARNKLIDFAKHYRIERIADVLDTEIEDLDETIKTFLISMYNSSDIDHGKELPRSTVDKYVYDNLYNLIYSYAKTSGNEKISTSVPTATFLETLESVLSLMCLTSTLRDNLNKEVEVIKKYNIK